MLSFSPEIIAQYVYTFCYVYVNYVIEQCLQVLLNDFYVLRIGQDFKQFIIG